MGNKTAHSENTISYEQGAGYLIEEDFSKIPVILDRISEERRADAMKKEIEKEKKDLDLRSEYIRMLEEADKLERRKIEEKRLEESNRAAKDKKRIEEIRNASNKLLNNER